MGMIQKEKERVERKSDVGKEAGVEEEKVEKEAAKRMKRKYEHKKTGKSKRGNDVSVKDVDRGRIGTCG